MSDHPFRDAVDRKDLEAALLAFEADPLSVGDDDPRLLRRFGQLALRGDAAQAAQAAYGIARRFAPASDRDYGEELIALLRDPGITEDAIIDELLTEALKVHPRGVDVAHAAVQVGLALRWPATELVAALERLQSLEPLDAENKALLAQTRGELHGLQPAAEAAVGTEDFLRLPGLVAQSRFDEAVELVNALRVRFPREPLVDRLAAQVALRRGDRQAARDALETYVARVPYDVWGVSLLASTLSHGGEHEAGLGLLDDARQQGVDHELVDMTAAEIFVRIGQWELAAESYAAVPVHSTHHVRAALGQLTAIERYGDIAAARALAADLAQRYPGQPTIRDRLAALGTPG